MSRILVVDDEPAVLRFLQTLLQRESYEVTVAPSGEQALSELGFGTFDLMITDCVMSPMDGMELLRVAQRDYPDMPVVMISGFSTVENAVEVLKAGAFDYLPKPVKVEDLKALLRRALEYHDVMTQRQAKQVRLGPGGLVAESPAMETVCEMIQRIVPTDTPVLLLGEPGSGKKKIARTIHDLGTHRDHPFLVVDCAVRPDAELALKLFAPAKPANEAAGEDAPDVEGGTLYLEEIGSLPLDLQDLLILLLSASVHGTDWPPARIIAGSSDPLPSMVEKGNFRQELYQRLSVFNVAIPPLRERPADVLGLTHHLLKQRDATGAGTCTLRADAELVLEHYAWPGNATELVNVVQSAVERAVEGVVEVEDLPPMLAQVVDVEAIKQAKKMQLQEYKGRALKAFLRSKEKEYLSAVLDSVNDDKEEAARKLQVAPGSFDRYLSDDGR